MTMIYTKAGKRRKLTDALSNAHSDECRKKILAGDFREVGIKRTFSVEAPGRFTFHHYMVEVEVVSEVQDTSLWHQCLAFAYWEVEEFSSLGAMRHQGQREFCYRSVNWDVLDQDAVEYSKKNVTLLPSETWDDVINGWKGRLI